MSRRDLEARRPWQGARVVLGVTGGIAAYKAIQLARDLTRLGAEVDTVLTRSALHFVQPLTFEGVTGRPVHSELFHTHAEDGAEGGAALHIRLGLDADVVCIAPATADLIARSAQGRADDLLTTTLLVTRAPVLLCPAMNDRMFSHPQLQANLAHCRETLGYRIAGPAEGPLAYGEGEGPGRLLEPDEIVQHLGRTLGADRAFSGRTVLVTAGPTREPIDPVRYVGNRSSGRMGYALAREAWLRGARVILVSGPTALDAPAGVQRIAVETAREMEEAVRTWLPSADLAIFAAAVADYRPEGKREGKIKRAEEGDAVRLDLVANPDVAADTREARKTGAFVVGFALESEALLENARTKLREKGFDLIVANPVGADTGFEVETNRATLVAPDGEEEETLPLQSKDALAGAVLDRIAARMDAEGA